MISNQVEVTRQCIRCEKTRQDIEPFYFLSINHAVGIVSRSSKRCGDCQSDELKIVHIRLDIIDGWIYGDKDKGYWKCPSHNDIYYPAAIQRVVDSEAQCRDNLLLEKYRPVVSTGYPWRCPVCGEEMYYFDERENKQWVG